VPPGTKERFVSASCALAAVLLAADLALRAFRPLSPAAEGIGIGAAAVLAAAAAAASRLSRRARPPAPDPEGEKGPPTAAGGMNATVPMIFHEIKNYASALKGNTELLRRKLPAGTAEENLDRLERATQRIAGLAREVLDISMLGTPAERREVDLDGLVRDCSAAYFQGLPMGFRFVRDRARLRISGDPAKLEQVFLNLFKNSLEAGATLLQASLIGQQGRVTVILEDDGIGCTPEQVGRMFDAYHSFKRGHGGTGLGLFLVKAIVEGHAGTISAVSKNQKEPGARGMLFILNFPSIPDPGPGGPTP
jgi:signal transduction histidine kinase